MNINKRTPVYSISAAAKLIGVSVHTMRMYEKEGLIIPYKEEGHNRLYSQNDIDRLLCIRRSIKEKKFSIAAIKTIYSFIPCWNIINCPESDRDKCEAYSGTVQPCWMYSHEQSYCKNLECKNCEVYNRFTNCDQIKDEINNQLRRV